MPDYKSRDIAQLQVVGYTVCFAVAASCLPVKSGAAISSALSSASASLLFVVNTTCHFQLTPPPELY